MGECVSITFFDACRHFDLGQESGSLCQKVAKKLGCVRKQSYLCIVKRKKGQHRLKISTPH